MAKPLPERIPLKNPESHSSVLAAWIEQTGSIGIAHFYLNRGMLNQSAAT